MNKILILILIIVGVLVVIGITMYYTASNSEIGLRNQITAQQTVCESFFDKMWKVINQKAQVADQYKEAFKDIYPTLIDGRYKNDNGTFMKWITESNPNFDVSLYKDLSVAIEAERTGFFTEQKTLIDLKREHDNLRQKFPSSIFVGGRPEIKITVILSSNTDEVYKTGKEENIQLFEKK
jgi:hypothetical protein